MLLLNKYIHYPAGSVEHTSVDAHRQFDETRDTRSGWGLLSAEEKAKVKSPVTDTKKLAKETRVLKSKGFM